MFTEKLIMLEESIRKLFSNQSRLISLQLDITCYDSYVDLHECLKPCITHSSFPIFKHRACCLTLRRLYIYIKYTCFLEYLIEYVPVLEQLSVHFCHSFNIWRRSTIDNDTLQTNGNWFNKVRKKEDSKWSNNHCIIMCCNDRLLILTLYYRSSYFTNNLNL
jgi:hypothetical protein